MTAITTEIMVIMNKNGDMVGINMVGINTDFPVVINMTRCEQNLPGLSYEAQRSLNLH